MFARNFWDDINDFRRSFDQAFENLYSSARRGSTGEGGDWAFQPGVETGWSEDSLNLRVVLPGVAAGDLNLSVQGNQLTIRGERKAPENFGKEAVRQLTYGKFERVLDLPNGLDLENLKAHMHDGVRDLHIPVAQAMKPKQIQINATEPGTAKKIAA